MLSNGTVWLLLADGRRARVLVEERRGAALSEPTAWVMQISEEDLYDPQDRPPRSFESVGAARHGMDGGRNLHEKEEENFLKRVAARVTEAEKQGGFAHLVVAAPPRALGLLRAQFPPAVKARVRNELDKDLLDEDTPRLRERLRELLR
jgi:protein required for attachment to host cells